MSEKISPNPWPHEANSTARPDCPPRKRLHRLALREALGAEQRSRLQEHLNDCPACTAEHDVAVLFESGYADDIDTSAVAKIVARLEHNSPVRIADGRRHALRRDQDRNRVRTWFGRPRALAGWQLAAAATFVAVLALSTVAQPPALPSAHETTLRGSAVRTISPQGDVGVSPARLAWQPYPQTTTYLVRLLRVDDTVLWAGMVANSKIDLPASVGEQLQPLVRYVWTVEALDEAGALVAASQPQSFRIRQANTPAPQGR